MPWLYNLYKKIQGKLWILQLLAQWEIYSQWIFADSVSTFIFHEHSFWQSCFAKVFLESKHQKDLKHRKRGGGGGGINRHSMESTCWIHPGLLLCCFAQSFISLLVWRLKVAISENGREWQKLNVSASPSLAQWFRTPSHAQDGWNRACPQLSPLPFWKVSPPH